MSADDLPSYDELSSRKDAPPGSAWGLFGEDDQLGLLNLMTPERVTAAARLVRKGAVFPLNLRIDRPDPPLFGRGAVRHHLEAGPVSRDDYLDNFWPQASSQWDSLRHIRHPDDGFYNGTPDDQIVSGEGGRLGIEQVARRGIATRGVLLDVARYQESLGRPLDLRSPDAISVETLIACAEAQAIAVGTGDVLVIRTGWLRWYLEEATSEERQRMAGDATANLRCPGIDPGEEMAAYLWDLHIIGVAADNPSVEAWPPTPEGGFLHFRLIPHFGMLVGELWDLEALAADCAEDGVYEFMLTSEPLNVPGGVGSPPNALAIK